MKAVTMERTIAEDSALEDFEVLYARYHRLVRSVIFKIGLADNVDDLVQETFLKIWKGRAKVREPQKLTAWVCRVAVNTARDAGRSFGRRPKTVALSETIPAPTGPRPEEQQRILRGLAELSAAHREVIVLHCLEDVPQEEIAEALGISVGTVKSRVHYGKAQLLEFLKRNGGVP